MILAIAILTTISCGTAEIDNPYSESEQPVNVVPLLDAYAEWYCECDEVNTFATYGEYCACAKAGMYYSQFFNPSMSQCVIPEIAESCYDWFAALNCDPMPPECEPSSLAVPCQE